MPQWRLLKVWLLIFVKLFSRCANNFKNSEKPINRCSARRGLSSVFCLFAKSLTFKRADRRHRFPALWRGFSDRSVTDTVPEAICRKLPERNRYGMRNRRAGRIDRHDADRQTARHAAARRASFYDRAGSGTGDANPGADGNRPDCSTVFRHDCWRNQRRLTNQHCAERRRYRRHFLQHAGQR